MFFKNSKKKALRRLEELCNQTEIFIQVHYVPEQNHERHSLSTLTLKDDPVRQELYRWIEENGNPQTFAELCLLFLAKTKKDENRICDKAGLDRNYFSALAAADTYQPSKGEVFALCLAMCLTFEESKLLLKSAGYSIKNSSKAELTVRYFIENEIYQIDMLNQVLQKLFETSLSDF